MSVIARGSVACPHSEPLTIPPAYVMRLVEGECPACEISADGRTDDGFASCSCCGVAWIFDTESVTIRLRYVVAEDPVE